MLGLQMCEINRECHDGVGNPRSPSGDVPEDMSVTLTPSAPSQRPSTETQGKYDACINATGCSTFCPFSSILNMSCCLKLLYSSFKGHEVTVSLSVSLSALLTLSLCLTFIYYLHFTGTEQFLQCSY